MPELPDVELFKQYIDATSLHQKIDTVTVKNETILKGITAGNLKEKLEGKTFNCSRRHGKFLFVCIDTTSWLALHFGMTGFLKYFKRMEKESDHARLLFSFTNGYHLAYDCQRMLGKIQVIEDIAQFIKKKNLGPDPLDPDFEIDTFRRQLDGRKGMIKPTLMNQQIIAGIGNIYSDEILFQAKIHPKQAVSDLSNEKIENLFRHIRSVLESAISYHADPEKFPEWFLLPHRHKNGNCPKCHTTIKKITVSQRSSYYCPNCQKQ